MFKKPKIDGRTKNLLNWFVFSFLFSLFSFLFSLFSFLFSLFSFLFSLFSFLFSLFSFLFSLLSSLFSLLSSLFSLLSSLFSSLLFSFPFSLPLPLSLLQNYRKMGLVSDPNKPPKPGARTGKLVGLSPSPCFCSLPFVPFSLFPQLHIPFLLSYIFLFFFFPLSFFLLDLQLKEQRAGKAARLTHGEIANIKILLDKHGELFELFFFFFKSYDKTSPQP